MRPTSCLTTAKSCGNSLITLKSSFRERTRDGLINAGWDSIDNSGLSEKRPNNANERCGRRLGILGDRLRIYPTESRAMSLPSFGKSLPGLALPGSILTSNDVEAL